MYLTLPLPESRVRRQELTLITMDGSAPPIVLCIEVPLSGVQSAVAW